MILDSSRPAERPKLSLPELLASEELRQHEFPVTRNRVFLAHAGVCPLPRRVAAAIGEYAEQSTHGDQETLVPAFQLQKSRQLAADLIGAHPEEIAFVGPTSLALSYIAGGLRVRRNQNVLVYYEDYPSNVYPWMALANRGVEVRLLNIRQLGRIRLVDVLGQVDEGTRLVALASCHFISGYRIDLDEIGAALRKRGILFSVDGIQTVGAFPTSVANVDFLAADAHKWMLGPCAAGLLYVRREVQEEMRPIVYGWNNVRCPNFVAQEDMTFRPGASQYEAGSHNLLGLVGLNASMELLQEIGVRAIAVELLRKRAWLVPALREKGYSVLEHDAGASNASGIVTLFKPGTDLQALHKQLEEAGIIVSLRFDRSERQFIRLSPHFYNTDAELHRLLALL